MIAALVEAALRSLLVALAVWAGLQVFRVRNVLAQKAAWGLVLAQRLSCRCSCLWPLAGSLSPRRRESCFPPIPRPSSKSCRREFNPASPPRRPLPASCPECACRSASRFTAGRRITRSCARYSFQPPLPARPDASPLSAAPAPLPLLTRLPSPIQSPPEFIPPVAPLTTPRPFALAPALWLVYLLVVAALLLRLCYGLGTALRIWRGASPVSVDADSPLAAGLHLRASRAVSSPVTIGSAVVLPADYATWDSEKLRIVWPTNVPTFARATFTCNSSPPSTPRFSGSAPWAGGSNANSLTWPRPSATAPASSRPPAAPPMPRSCSNSRPRRAQPS